MLNEILKSLAKELGTFLNWKKWKKKPQQKTKTKSLLCASFCFKKVKLGSQ